MALPIKAKGNGKNMGVFKKNSKTLGKLRRSQLITTFGCGAIVNMPEMSVIIAGTDHWGDSPELHERNLERLQNVSHFKMPSVSENDRNAPNIPAFRFPYYHFCTDPKCGRLMRFERFKDADAMYCDGTNGHKHIKRLLVPSRFIAACSNGHLEDFPYEWWVHHGDYSKCPTKGRDALRISFSDKSGSLDSITIKCTACGATRKMTGCLNFDALKGYRCRGKSPWLHTDRGQPQTNCNAPLRVLQRGASNVYFPINVSALTIPPWSSVIQQEIDAHWSKIDQILAQSPPDNTLKVIVEYEFPHLIATRRYSVEEIVASIRERGDNSPSDVYTLQNIMEDEYRQLCVGDYSKEDDIQFRTKRTDIAESLKAFISDVVLVKRLREVMALRGFRRIYPDEPDDGDPRFFGNTLTATNGIVPLSEGQKDWLPAIELLGEGIFIRLNEYPLKKWEEANARRYDLMSTQLKKSNVGCENFSPRYVLLHTLAHLLIRQLTFECGYSGAAIKEKIYSTYPRSKVSMCGILIYTSSSDADGSLGGLVRNGLSRPLENIFNNMLREASWCASDPICIESRSQGYNSLNYAACHACTLLPETSCVMRNSLLDRVSVVGTPEDRAMGFFGELLEHQ